MKLIDKRLYSVEWNILNDKELKKNILREIPELIKIVNELYQQIRDTRFYRMKEAKSGVIKNIVII